MVMSPDYLSVLPSTLVGNLILLAAATMYGTGVFIMRTLSTVEV
jgi:Flp pilus assembly protein TadB